MEDFTQEAPLLINSSKELARYGFGVKGFAFGDRLRGVAEVGCPGLVEKSPEDWPSTRTLPSNSPWVLDEVADDWVMP